MYPGIILISNFENIPCGGGGSQDQGFPPPRMVPRGSILAWGGSTCRAPSHTLKRQEDRVSVPQSDSEVPPASLPRAPGAGGGRERKGVPRSRETRPQKRRNPRFVCQLETSVKRMPQRTPSPAKLFLFWKACETDFF